MEMPNNREKDLALLREIVGFYDRCIEGEANLDFVEHCRRSQAQILETIEDIEKRAK